MKFTIVLLAFVAAVSAQFGNGQDSPFNPYNRNQNRYRPYSSTPAPFRYRPSSPSVTIVPAAFPSSTPAPFYASTAAPFYASTAAPFYASTRAPVPVVARVTSDNYNAETLKFGNENNPDGSFNYFYETSNGIAAQEQGVPRNFGGNPPVEPVVVQGSFSWTSPEGQPIAISYVADENGYQPSGDALPTPPPLPPQIARALAYISQKYLQK